MQLKPSNAGQRTISTKRVSSKTLETPSICPKNRPEIWRSEFFGIQEGDTFHPLRKRILFDSRLNLNIENQFLEIPSSTLLGAQWWTEDSKKPTFSSKLPQGWDISPDRYPSAGSNINRFNIKKDLLIFGFRVRTKDLIPFCRDKQSHIAQSIAFLLW